VAVTLAVFSGYCIQTIAGFGSVLVAVTVAANFLPISTLLLFILPLSLAQCAYIGIRYHGAIDRRLLLRWIVPVMAVGTAGGAVVATQVSGDLLKRGLAAMILLLSAAEVVKRLRPSSSARDLGAVGRSLGLLGAGIMHGLYGTGGPLLVYTVGRIGLDKSAFRSTLTAVWLLLNIGLVGYFILDGRYSLDQLWLFAVFTPALILGVWLGEVLHRRIDGERFSSLVYIFLTVAAVSLLIR